MVGEGVLHVALNDPGIARHTQPYFRYLGWVYPLLRRLAPNSAYTLEELAKAMLRIAKDGHPSDVIEVRDLR